MRKMGLKLVAALALAALPLAGGQDVFQAGKQQISEEIKNTLTKEVESFFVSDDLSKTLGISQAERSDLERSIRGYIDSYELDEDALDEAKQAVGAVLEGAKGLSAVEIQEKIAALFEQDK